MAFDPGAAYEPRGIGIVLHKEVPTAVVNMNRELSFPEKELLRWMLEHGTSGARAFLVQLEKAMATCWRCPCGCASIDLVIDGMPEPSGKFQIIGDFLFGDDDDLSGVFVFEKNGVLAGLEVYGLAGEAPKVLPVPQSLRPFREQSEQSPRN